MMPAAISIPASVAGPGTARISAGASDGTDSWCGLRCRPGPAEPRGPRRQPRAARAGSAWVAGRAALGRGPRRAAPESARSGSPGSRVGSPGSRAGRPGFRVGSSEPRAGQSRVHACRQAWQPGGAESRGARSPESRAGRLRVTGRQLRITGGRAPGCGSAAPSRAPAALSLGSAAPDRARAGSACAREGQERVPGQYP